MNTYSYTIDQIREAQIEFEQKYENYQHHTSKGKGGARPPNLFEILESSKYIRPSITEMLKSRVDNE